MGWVGRALGKFQSSMLAGGWAFLPSPSPRPLACYIDPALVYVALSLAPGPLSPTPLPATSTRPMLHKPLCSGDLLYFYTQIAPRHLLHKGSAPWRFSEPTSHSQSLPQPSPQPVGQTPPPKILPLPNPSSGAPLFFSASRRRLCSALFGQLLWKNTKQTCYIKVYVAPARFM